MKSRHLRRRRRRDRHCRRHEDHSIVRTKRRVLELVDHHNPDRVIGAAAAHEHGLVAAAAHQRADRANVAERAQHHHDREVEIEELERDVDTVAA